MEKSEIKSKVIKHLMGEAYQFNRLMNESDVSQEQKKAFQKKLEGNIKHLFSIICLNNIDDDGIDKLYAYVLEQEEILKHL